MAKPLKRGLAPNHPGEILRLTVLPSLLTERDMPKGAFAERLGVSYDVLDNLVSGKTNMTPSLALRLGRVLGNEPQFWMNLQANYDLWKAEAAMGEHLAALKPVGKLKAW
ncbi:HigA family addiction module antitoxin [uncultured Phenylobacterium sp.]|uniref:HigA family addiction module antitoxin n=1 Tax=uncultured Phenylobacterium sp. TaxID=349273 RepID=UPI00260058E6|nr:HigA family addiction module antitoxin [uncultured Phenylobacterium sp.]